VRLQKKVHIIKFLHFLSQKNLVDRTHKQKDEKHFIFTFVKKYRNIVENKKADATTCHDKTKTWRKIQNEFNARLPNSCRRNVELLKKFYYNKKKEVRKVAAEEKKEAFLIGGGKSKVVKKDNLLLSLMRDTTVYGLSNRFDCDNIPSTRKDFENES
jgi:hypothetical protein